MGERLRVDIEKRIGGFQLAIELQVGTEILVLFGPSGAGKTQTLNAVAGLVTPDRGEIRLDGRVLFKKEATGPHTNIPTRERRTAMVFQQYALFPHLTARQNIAFGLRGRRRDHALADNLLDRMRLGPLADRYPHELSGGQQQRVAIARAVAADSNVLLLDEPFSSLDRPTREQLHLELQSLQEETGLVILYVTHSMEDALVAGRRIAIIDHGRVEQIAPVEEIFTRPRSRSVLEILGVPNLFEGEVRNGYLDWNGVQLTLPGKDLRMVSDHPGREMVVGYIPAEDVRISAGVQRATSAANQSAGRVASVQAIGLSRRIRVELTNGQQIEAIVRDGDAFAKGDLVEVTIPGDRLILVKQR